jgi:hypothetical protein
MNGGIFQPSTVTGRSAARLRDFEDALQRRSKAL